MKPRDLLEELSVEGLRRLCKMRGLTAGGARAARERGLALSYRNDLAALIADLRREDLIKALSADFELEGGEQLYFKGLGSASVDHLRTLATKWFVEDWAPTCDGETVVRGSSIVAVLDDDEDDDAPCAAAVRSEFSIRQYQKVAVERAIESLGSTAPARTLISLPTGSGKTIVGLLAAAQFARNGVVQWLAYQRELKDQARSELECLRRNGLLDDQVEFDFETVQKHRRLRLLNGTKLIVVDEAHHLHGSTEYWKDIRKRRVPILGLTGTPRRSHAADGWDLAEYVPRADLTPRYLAVQVPFRVPTGFTPRHVGVQQHFYGRDFDAETYRALDTPRRNKWVAAFLRDHARRLGRMLVFVHKQDHCERLARACGNAGLSAAYVHGAMTNRDQVFRDFESGAVQVLVNAKLVSEGNDVPGLDTVVMAVPTMSDIRFSQMLGRGCRRTPTKSHFNVVDLVDNLGRFDSLLAGRYLFDGTRSRGEFDSSAVTPLDYYKTVTQEHLEQPYLQALARQLRTGFLNQLQAAAISADGVEFALLRFSEQRGVALSLDESRPLEVHLVHEHVLPLLASSKGGAGARKEMACADGTRCDIFVPGDPAGVMEFSTRRVGKEKARQLLGYVENFREDGVAKRILPTLVAISYEGDARSRRIEVDGVRVEFLNWHDFIRNLLDLSEKASKSQPAPEKTSSSSMERTGW